MYTEIKTVEDAFARQKDVDLSKLPDLSALPAKISRGLLALLKLQVIVSVINNDDANEPEWKADFNNRDQRKWYPWYVGGDHTGAGFRFFDAGYNWALTTADGGVRLALKDEGRANHMNEFFQDLYKELWLILE